MRSVLLPALLPALVLGVLGPSAGCQHRPADGRDLAPGDGGLGPGGDDLGGGAADLRTAEDPRRIARLLPAREHGHRRVSAVDSRGDIYLTGHFQEDQDFGGGPLKGRGSDDGFLLKVGADGTHRFSRVLGGPGYDGGVAVATDTKGAAVIATFEGQADLGGGPLQSRSKYGCALGRYEADGAHRFSLAFDLLTPGSCYDVAIDEGGDTWLVGVFSRSLVLSGAVPGGLPLTSLTSHGESDGYYARFGADGRLLRAQRFGGGRGGMGLQVATAPAGQVALAGLFTGTLDLEGLGGAPITSDSDGSSFFALLGPDGKARWARTLGRAGNWVFSLALTADALYVGGEVQGTVDFGGGPTMPVGTRDGYVARYDHGGRLGWARRFGAVAGAERAVIGWSVGLAGGGDVVLAGEFVGALSVGARRHESRGGVDGFAIRLSPAGEPLGSFHFGAAESSVYEVTAPARSGAALVLSGSLFGTVDFAGTTLSSTSRSQIFLLQLPDAPILTLR